MKRLAIALLLVLSAVPAAAQRSEEEMVVRVAQQITPAVVGVSREEGSGSGVLIRSDGVILTNAHVVGDVATVDVSLADGRTLPGTVLGRDRSVDVAVVRVQSAGLPAAPLGDSDRLRVGQLAIAIGNPLGLDRTVTTGVVSAINRDPRDVPIAGGLIQTDAAIQPRQLGRAARRLVGPRHRHQHRDPRRSDGPRLRHPHQPRQRSRHADPEHRSRPAHLPRRAVRRRQPRARAAVRPSGFRRDRVALRRAGISRRPCRHPSR